MSESEQPRVPTSELERFEALPGGATWSEAPGLMSRGLAMGLAEVVPGVSGGTLALITGIYARLILAVKSFDRGALRHLLARRLADLRDHVAWRFLLLVGIGQAAGIVVFSQFLPTWTKTHPELVYGAFFGLIVGSIILIGRDVLRRGLTWRVGLAALGGLGLGLAVVTAVPPEGTPDAPWFLFVCGCIAISAMILPGISGSFVLLILRKYEVVIGAVGTVTRLGEGAGAALVNVLLPFALGCVVGVVTFSRFLSYLFKRAEQATLSCMVGVMAGSLWVIWPFQEREYAVVRGKEKLLSSTPVWPGDDAPLLATVLLLVAALGAVLLMDAVARRRVPEARRPPGGAPGDGSPPDASPAVDSEA